MHRFLFGFLALLAIVPLSTAICKVANTNIPSYVQSAIRNNLSGKRQAIGRSSINWDNQLAALAAGLYNNQCNAWHYERNTTDCNDNMVGVLRNYIGNLDMYSSSGANGLVDTWWATENWSKASVDADIQGYYYNTVSNSNIRSIGCSMAPQSCDRGNPTAYVRRRAFFYCIVDRYVAYTPPQRRTG